MAMLWPDEKDKCPVGALRNLVYRARKELEHLYPDKDVDYIKFTQDAYYWNPDLYCKIDIHDFENYNNLIRKGSSVITTGCTAFIPVNFFPTTPPSNGFSTA